MSKDVTLAAVAGAHGIGGAVRLKLFTESLDSLEAQKTFNIGDKILTLQDIRPDKAGAIARFAEVRDRTAAEALRGTLLTVPRASLPPLDDGEYYHIDYLGRAVQSPDGTPMGVVKSVNNYGASDILEIELEGGKTVLVPFIPAAVAETDETLIIDPVWLA